MNVISLFVESGGFDLEFERAGFNVIWTNKCDSSIFEIYKKSPKYHVEYYRCGLLKDQDISSCDGVIGGPHHVKHGVKVASNLDLKTKRSVVLGVYQDRKLEKAKVLCH